MNTEYAMSSGKFQAVEWRVYASRRSAERYGKKHGLTIVESRQVGTSYPDANDARGWDDLRMRAGAPSNGR